jgi:hypothetical protein
MTEDEIEVMEKQIASEPAPVMGLDGELINKQSE